MEIKRSFFILFLALTACRPFLPSVTPLPTSSKLGITETPSRTPIPGIPTTTQTPTPTQTASSPTPTRMLPPTPLTQTAELTLPPTSTPASQATQPTEGPGPGLVVRGYVKLEDGTPVEGVTMLVAFSAYGGNIVAVTNSTGYYSSEYIYIPGDETIRVWAEAAGYHFKPGNGSAVWTGIEFYWRHYFGFEDISLDFTAISDPLVP